MSDGYCPKCGAYMPLTLDGTCRVHQCHRTPPLGGLPHGICACPICGGYGPGRYGCWGTIGDPHDHAYMRPIHELVRAAGARMTRRCSRRSGHREQAEQNILRRATEQGGECFLSYGEASAAMRLTEKGTGHWEQRHPFVATFVLAPDAQSRTGRNA